MQQMRGMATYDSTSCDLEDDIVTCDLRISLDGV